MEEKLYFKDQAFVLIRFDEKMKAAWNSVFAALNAGELLVAQPSTLQCASVLHQLESAAASLWIDLA